MNYRWRLLIFVGVGAFGVAHLWPQRSPASLAELKHSPTYQRTFEKVRLQLAKSASIAERQFLAHNMACFAPGTDPAIVAAFEEAMGHHAEHQDYIAGPRWTGTTGTAKALTWSFVPDGISLINAFLPGIGDADTPSNLFAQFDSKFASQGGRAFWVGKFQQCFDRWQQLTGVSFTRITFGGNDWDDGAAFGAVGAAGLRGDVRIGGHSIDGPGTAIAYAYGPNDGEMVIDTDETTNYTSTSNSHRNFRNVVMHELGHSLGFAHVQSATNAFLMEAFLQTAIDGPQLDDIRGVQFSYGDKFENNGSVAAATDLGVKSSGSFTVGDVPQDPAAPPGIPASSSICSISKDGDLDFYKFTINVGGTMTATVQPTGGNYSSGPVGGPEANLNASTVTPLSVQIFAPDGTTSLAFKAANVAGEAPTTPVATLSGPGTYYIRVAELTAPTQSQLYKLTCNLTLNNQPPVLNPIGAQSLLEGLPLTFNATATDPDSGQTITYSMSGAPAGATLDSSTGAFSWTPAEADGPGTYFVTFTATDNGSPALSDSEVVKLDVNEVNRNPSLIWSTPNNTVVREGNSLVFDANATDPDIPANTLTFSLVTAPVGATINPTTGVFSWTPTLAQIPASHTLTVRVSDGAGGIAQRTITLLTRFSIKTFKGIVDLDAWPLSRYPEREFTIEIRSVGSLTPLHSYNGSADETGQYVLETDDFAAGTYDVRIWPKFHLAKLFSSQVINLGGSEFPDATLLSADCDHSNYITTDDYLIFSSSFDLGLGDPGFLAEADFNGDDFVTTDDYLVLSQNFDTGGDD